MSYYIFLDIDGTLLDFDQEEILEQTVRDIRQAQANGAKVFINTGRTLSEIQPYLLNFGFDGICSACGGDIYYEGKHIYHEPFGIENVRFMERILPKQNVMVTFEGQEKNYAPMYLKEQMEQHFKGFKRRFDLNYSHLPLRDDAASQIMKITIMGFKYDASWCSAVSEKFKFIMHKTPFDNMMGGEVVLKHHSKAAVIEELKKYVNDPNFFSIGIGDGMNDAEMLQESDASFWMNNGNPDAMQFAKDVTCSVKQNGIGEALRKVGVIV